jgi:hypothetical protein
MRHFITHPRAILFTLATVNPVASSVACDLCRVYNAPLAHGVIEQGFHLAISEQFTHYGTLQFESHEVPNEAGQFLDSSVSQAVLGYHFNDRFGVQFNLPVIYRSFRRAEGGGIDKGTESGLGDVALAGNYTLLRRDQENWSVAWSVLGGVKFPTGDTDRLREELNEEEPAPGEIESAVHGHDLTLGSGSYDGFVGTEFYVRSQRWFFTAETQYAIRSTGDFDYRFANDLTWSGGPGYYLVFGEDLTVALQVDVSGESKAMDHFRGEKAEDTGLTAVFLGPRLSVSWKGKLSAEVSAAFPVDIQNSALQAVADYRVQGGLVWRF